MLNLSCAFQASNWLGAHDQQALIPASGRLYVHHVLLHSNLNLLAFGPRSIKVRLSKILAGVRGFTRVNHNLVLYSGAREGRIGLSNGVRLTVRL